MSHVVVSRLLPILAVLVGLGALVVLLPLAPSTSANGHTPPYVELTGFAVLPADTFAPGPPSGSAIEGDYMGRTPPFENQPVQGISAILPKWNGNWLIMSDNGFGSKANSADYRLRWYEVSPDFEAGTVEVLGYTELSDPNNLIPWPIQNENSDRVLTGADFDLESFRLAPDGTFWFGEEFGPFLLHFDAQGRLLAAPIPTPYPAELAPYAKGLPSIQAPENPAFFDLPTRDDRVLVANHPPSRGFEGMAMNTSGTYLYPLLEGPMAEDPVRTRLLIREFSLRTLTYTDNYWYYPLSDSAHAIGDMTAINDDEFLVIERDSNEGGEASFKRIYKINLANTGIGGMAEKELVVDLLAITDVGGITTPEEGAVGFGPVFSFPFVTIEAVYPIDSTTLLVTNDNNYPFSSGRRPGIAPDDNEFIRLKLTEENKLGLDN